MILRLVDNLEDLALLREKWDALVEQHDDPDVYFYFDWAFATLKHLCDANTKPFVIVGQDQGAVVAIMPLCLERKKLGPFNFSVLHMMTSETRERIDLADYCDVYVAKGYSAREFLKRALEMLTQAKERWHYVELMNFSTRNPMMFQISDLIGVTSQLHENMTVVSEQGALTPFILFQNTAHIDQAKKIRQIRRKTESLRQEHTVEIRIQTAPVPELWDQFMALHKKRWSKSAFYNPRVVNFYEEVANQLHEKGKLDFSCILVDGVVAAAHLGFTTPRKINAHTIVFDEAYQKYAIGLIMMQEIIDHYGKTKQELDFQRGALTYKFLWADRARRNFHFYLINRQLDVFTRSYILGYTLLRKLIRSDTWAAKAYFSMKAVIERFKTKSLAAGN